MDTISINFKKTTVFNLGLFKSRVINLQCTYKKIMVFLFMEVSKCASSFFFFVFEKQNVQRMPLSFANHNAVFMKI